MDHVFYECPPGCDNPVCNYCMGGLGLCTVCGEAEGGLAKECPGPPKPVTIGEIPLEQASKIARRVLSKYRNLEEDKPQMSETKYCANCYVNGFVNCPEHRKSGSDEPKGDTDQYSGSVVADFDSLDWTPRERELSRQLQAERTRREDDQRKGAELCNVLGNLMHQHHRLTRVTEQLVGAMEGGMNPDLRADAKEVLRDTKLTDEAVQRWKAKYPAQDSSSTSELGDSVSENDHTTTEGE